MANDNLDAAEPTGGDLATVRPDEVFLAETALLRKVIGGLGLRAGDADDVLQSISVKCLNHAGPFTNWCQCRRWLIRVTTNECLTEHRRIRRFRRHVANILERRPRSATNGPVQSAVSSEQLEAVREALRDLDDELLRPLVLKYFCDLSSTEIGQTLDMPASTVRSVLRKGRMALAKALMKRGIER